MPGPLDQIGKVSEGLGLDKRTSLPLVQQDQQKDLPEVAQTPVFGQNTGPITARRVLASQLSALFGGRFATLVSDCRTTVGRSVAVAPQCCPFTGLLLESHHALLSKSPIPL